MTYLIGGTPEELKEALKKIYDTFYENGIVASRELDDTSEDNVNSLIGQIKDALYGI